MKNMTKWKGDPGMEDMKSAFKAYMLKEFLPGEDPDELTESTPLITEGILDSLATLKLVTFIEEKYGIEFRPHEVSVDYLNTIADIAAFVQSKLQEKTDDVPS